MTSRTRVLAALGAVAAVMAGGNAAPAAAAEGGSLICSGSEAGSLSCIGEMRGLVIAGTGYYESRPSDDDDSCLTGNGLGSFTATLPVVTVIGERTLTVDADYRYTRTGFVRIASGTADLTLTDYPLLPLGGHGGATEEYGRVAFSSVAALLGSGGLDLCGLGDSLRWAEEIGLGPAAGGLDSGVAPLAASLRRGACANHQTGTASADSLIGTPAGDRLAGQGGADRVKALGGHDCLTGGAGGDALSGGSGHDSLSGGRAADRLGGGAGSDALTGGAGLDSYSGGPGRDAIDSRDGRSERVRCGAGHDSVRADAGDRLSGCESRGIG